MEEQLELEGYGPSSFLLVVQNAKCFVEEPFVRRL